MTAGSGPETHDGTATGGDDSLVVRVHPVFVDDGGLDTYELTVTLDGPVPVEDLLDRLQADHPVRLIDAKGTLLPGRGVVVDGQLVVALDVTVSPGRDVAIDLVPSFVGG